nr:Major facilitator superfamily MFS-1 domain containing protein [Haemonchus contortus]
MLRRPGEHDEPHAKRLWSKTESRIWTFTLFTGTSVLYASRVALPICAAAIAKEFSWNKTDSGTVLSCFFWGYAITQLIAGGIADTYGGENVLPITSLVWIVLTIFTPQLFDFAYWSGFPLIILLLTRILTGIGQAFHIPSMASMVSRHLTAADKGRVFGIILAGSHCGTVLAGSIGSLLVDKYGWRTLFQFVGILSLFWYWILHFVLSRSLYRQQLLLTDSEADLVKKNRSESNATLSLSGISIASASVPWRALFGHPAFWAAAVAQYTGGNAYFTMFNWLPSYFHESFPEAQGIVYNVVPNLAIVVTALLAPFLAARLLNGGKSMTVTRKLMEGVSLVGVAVCLFLVPCTSSFTPALLIFTTAMACRGLHHGGVSVNPHDFAPHHTGAVFGIFNACGAITGFIGVYVAGHILDATDNNWSYVFIITGIQCVIGAAIYGRYGTGSKII